MPTKLPAGKSKTARDSSAEFQHGGIFTIAMADVRPAPVNDTVYTAIDADDPGIVEMARQMADPAIGQLEPIVLTTDNMILSTAPRK